MRPAFLGSAMSPLPGVNQSHHNIVSVDRHHCLLVQHLEPFHNGRHEVSGNVLGKADRDSNELAEILKRLLSQSVALTMKGEHQLIVQKKLLQCDLWPGVVKAAVTQL